MTTRPWNIPQLRKPDWHVVFYDVYDAKSTDVLVDSWLIFEDREEAIKSYNELTNRADTVSVGMARLDPIYKTDWPEYKSWQNGKWVAQYQPYNGAKKT